MTGNSTLGNLNPFRYRSYYYYSETGFYYLQSRYYDPQVGRFINADAMVSGVGESVQGYNMYAYCWNNPATMSDEYGCWPSWKQIFKAAVTVAVAAVTIAAVIVAAPAIAGAVGGSALFYGASMATAAVLSTAVTVTCTVLASSVAVLGINKAVEDLTETNYIAEVIGEKAYENIESTVNMATMMIIAAPQVVGYPSTGRTEARDLKEQVCMNLTKSNPSAGTVIIKSLGDTRMPGWLGWQKYSYTYPLNNGSHIDVHYLGNKYIPFYFDFKFSNK